MYKFEIEYIVVTWLRVCPYVMTTVNYRHFAHAHNNAHPPKIPKYRSKILYLTYGRYNAHPLKIQFLNLQAHGRYGGRLRYNHFVKYESLQWIEDEYKIQDGCHIHKNVVLTSELKTYKFTYCFEFHVNSKINSEHMLIFLKSKMVGKSIWNIY